jgi:hypothetical protein
MRRKRLPIPCEECGTEFKPHRASTRFCSVACRRAVDARVCRNGHDLTLPGATRPQKGGKASRCIACETEAGERYRRRIGKKPREEFLGSVRKTDEQRRETRRLAAERARRRRGIRPRAEANAAKRVKRERAKPKPKKTTYVIDGRELAEPWEIRRLAKHAHPNSILAQKLGIGGSGMRRDSPRLLESTRRGGLATARQRRINQLLSSD